MRKQKIIIILIGLFVIAFITGYGLGEIINDLLKWYLNK